MRHAENNGLQVVIESPIRVKGVGGQTSYFIILRRRCARSSDMFDFVSQVLAGTSLLCELYIECRTNHPIPSSICS